MKIWHNHQNGRNRNDQPFVFYAHHPPQRNSIPSKDYSIKQNQAPGHDVGSLKAIPALYKMRKSPLGRAW